MATITLYANKINQMPSLIKDVKQSVADYKTELSELRKKTLTINKSVCDLNNVICSIQSSSQTQDQKIDSLEKFNQNSEAFITDVTRIDREAAEVVRKRKDDFYEKYQYLKPECEKNGWEKFKDGCKKVGEWCKEHWVTIVTVIIVVLVAAIAVVCGVAIAFIAAVAGLVALVIFLADVICMCVTGGKDIATVLRENGFYVLADIFQGVSIGADIVSIAFPIGTAIKTMTKVGVRKFLVRTGYALKEAFKETIEKVFKSGFKDGIKNFLNISFKSLIFDVDDLKNWKAVKLDVSGHNKHWIREGDKLIPKSDSIPKMGRGGIIIRMVYL